MNPGRNEMPDIDLDFCQARRGEMIDYVTQKYGRDCVCQIITFNTLGAKASLRDVGRVLEVPLSEVDKLAKKVPDGVKVKLVPLSGQVDPDVAAYCNARGVELTTVGVEALEEVDAIYLNAPRTVAHAELLKARGALNVRIDEEFMSRLQPHCVILDPMQRSGDFSVDVEDERLAFYRQSENALFVRMALLRNMLAG